MPKHTTPRNVTNLQEYRRRKQQPPRYDATGGPGIFADDVRALEEFDARIDVDTRDPEQAADLEAVRNIFDAADDSYTEKCPQCGAQMMGYFIGRKNRWIACDPCGIAQPTDDHGWHGLLNLADEAGGDPGEWLEQHYQESREYLKNYGVIGGHSE